MQNVEEDVVNIHADQVINFLQLASEQDAVGENKYELSLLTATAGGSAPTQKDGDKFNSQLNKVGVPHSGFRIWLVWCGCRSSS